MRGSLDPWWPVFNRRCDWEKNVVRTVRRVRKEYMEMGVALPDPRMAGILSSMVMIARHAR